MRLEEINKLIHEAYGTYTDTYSFFDTPTLIDIRKSSTQRNKRQNSELREGDPECVIKSILDGNGLWYEIKAKGNYSRKQWMLILAGDALCLPVQDIKAVLK
jgi:hypothetical protein